MGTEFRAKGANVALSPMVRILNTRDLFEIADDRLQMNMGRVAAGGRNWEGFGGEPFLTGVCAAETVKGEF